MFKSLSEIYNNRDHFIRTAHRGASFSKPENTLLSMAEAVRCGADIIEFDLRTTADGEIVVLHDPTIDRTSNGQGNVTDLTLAELKKLNFSYFYREERHETPYAQECQIPTFEEILQAFSDKVAMNIQIYVGNEEALRKVVALYQKYNMYDRGYLAIGTLEYAKIVRNIDKNVEIALLLGWQDRSTKEKLNEAHEFGCRFVQPIAEFVSAESFELCKQLNLRDTVFFADTPDELNRLKSLGATGVLTNKIDILF